MFCSCRDASDDTEKRLFFVFCLTSSITQWHIRDQTTAAQKMKCQTEANFLRGSCLYLHFTGLCLKRGFAVWSSVWHQTSSGESLFSKWGATGLSRRWIGRLQKELKGRRGFPLRPLRKFLHSMLLYSMHAGWFTHDSVAYHPDMLFALSCTPPDHNKGYFIWR